MGLCCLCEFFVFEVVGMNEFKHRIPKQERVLPVIESPRHFIKVGCQMLCRYTMPRSHDPALQKRERGFNRVRVNVAFHIDAAPMLDRLVLAVMHTSPFHGEGVGHEFIRHNHVNIVAHVFFDVLSEGASLHILSMEEAKLAAALPESDHWFLCQKTGGRGYHIKAWLNTYLVNRRNRDEK